MSDVLKLGCYICVSQVTQTSLRDELLLPLLTWIILNNIRCYCRHVYGWIMLPMGSDYFFYQKCWPMKIIFWYCLIFNDWRFLYLEIPRVWIWHYALQQLDVFFALQRQTCSFKKVVIADNSYLANAETTKD